MSILSIQLKQIALIKPKSLNNTQIRYTGRTTIQLEHNKMYTVSSIHTSECNAYVSLTGVKTPFDVPFNIEQFELLEPIKQPVKRPIQYKYTKLTKYAMLIAIVFLIASISTNTLAASKHIATKPNRYTYHLHTIHKSKTSRVLTNTYKAPTHKVIKYTVHKTKTITYHLPKVKTFKYKVIHTHYAHIKTFKVSTFHTTHISFFHSRRKHF